MQELKKDYKTPMNEILSTSSLAFLLSPFRSKRFLIKITWSFFLLLFLFLSIYYVILNILDYLKYETTTSIQTIYEQEPEFPTISICNRLNKDFEIKILFHNYTENPKNIYRKGSIISSGTNNFFLIKRTLDQKLESPYNECLKDINQFAFDKTIIDYLNKSNRKYSQVECFNLCYNLDYNLTNPCECYLASLDEEPSFSCGNNNSCTEQFNNNFKQIEKCSHLCPLECDQYSYEIFHTPAKITGSGIINKFTDDYFYSFLPDFQTYENVSKTYYLINVYYENLKYTLISQQPKIELFGLISNLGGILGLFIGFSFISLLEIIEALAELIYVYFD